VAPSRRNRATAGLPPVRAKDDRPEKTNANGASANGHAALWRRSVHFRMPSVEASLALPQEKPTDDPDEVVVKKTESST
jgi:hypothetical protein